MKFTIDFRQIHCWINEHNPPHAGLGPIFHSPSQSGSSQSQNIGEELKIHEKDEAFGTAVKSSISGKLRLQQLSREPLPLTMSILDSRNMPVLTNEEPFQL